MMIRAVLLALACSIGLLSPALAQQSEGGAVEWLQETWRWRALGADVGLPTGGAQELIATDDGTTWARTSLGIAWFDGYAWHAAERTSSLRSPLTAVEAWGEDSLLVARGGHLYRVRRSGAQRVSLPTIIESGGLIDAVPLAPESILVLHEGNQGVRALLRLQLGRHGGVRSVEEVGPPPAAGELVGLWSSRSGAAWLETRAGLYLRGSSGWSPVIEAPGFAMTAIAARSPDFALVGVSRPASMRGLWVWRGRQVARPVPEGTGALVRSLETLGPEGAIAVLEAGRVMLRTAAGWDARAGRHSPLYRARSLLLQEGRGIWVASDESLHWIDGSDSPWDRWQFDFPDPRNRVTAVLSRSDGETWIGTDAGLVIRDSAGGMRTVVSLDGERLGRIEDLRQDAAGRIWMLAAGTTGAWVREGDAWGRVRSATPVAFRRIAPANGGAVWLVPDRERRAPGEGISAWAYRGSGDELTPWSPSSDSRVAPVNDLVETPAGELWLATDRGLTRYAEGAWRHWTDSDGLLPSPVQQIELDDRGRVWFAHADRGFGHVTPEGRVVYPDAVSGLSSARVRDIAVDRERDVLWIATASGLLRHGRGIWSRLDRPTGLLDPDLQRVAVADDAVVVGTSGSGVARLDLSAWPQAQPSVSLHTLRVRDGVLSARWTPLAAWGRVPSSSLSTRFRVGEGPWSAWGRHGEVVMELADEDAALQVQVADPLGLRGSPGRWSIDQSGLGGASQTTVLVLAALGTMLALLLAVRWVERSRSQRRARASERRWLDLLREAPDVIFSVDLEGNVLSVNEAGKGLLAHSGAPVRGQNLETLVARRSALTVRRMLLDALEGQVAPAYSIELADGNGGSVSLEVRTRPVVEDEVIVALQGIGRDVSHRQRAAKILHDLTVRLGADDGLDFLRSLTAGLARELGAQLALVGEVADGEGTWVRAVASWPDTDPGEAHRYPLAGTPCARVMEGAICVVTSDVCHEYPDDELLQQMGAESYVGIPLFGSDGRVVGLLAVVYGEPLEEPGLPKSILHAFSVRAAREMVGVRADNISTGGARRTA